MNGDIGKLLSEHLRQKAEAELYPPFATPPIDYHKLVADLEVAILDTIEREVRKHVEGGEREGGPCVDPSRAVTGDRVLSEGKLETPELSVASTPTQPVQRVLSCRRCGLTATYTSNPQPLVGTLDARCDYQECRNCGETIYWGPVFTAPNVCEFREAVTGFYDTACGKLLTWSATQLSNIGAKFCPWCGRPMRIKHQEVENNG